MKVIGLAANRPGAGKDTVAAMLREELDPGYVVKRQGFADALKLSAALALGHVPTGEGDDAVQDAVAWCDRLKDAGTVAAFLDEHGFTPDVEVSGRRFLQLYGTEAHRDVFGGNFWVDAVLPVGPAAKTRHPGVDVLLVPDVRFVNEAERVYQYGGEVWHVFAPGEADDDHSAETGLPPEVIHRHVLNVGTLDELRRIVRLTAHDAGLSLALPRGQS